MGRDKTKPVVHYAPMSGSLGGELKKHAIYLKQAREAMATYQAAQTKDKADGLAACAQCCLDLYDEPGTPERMYGDVHRAVAGDCWGLGLPPTSYLD